MLNATALITGALSIGYAFVVHWRLRRSNALRAEIAAIQFWVDLSARAVADLMALGNCDSKRHEDVGKHLALPVTNLEILGPGAMFACYYRNLAFVHQAMLAGASWPRIAAAVGLDEAQVRQAYRSWANSQHRLYVEHEGKIGLDASQHAAAIRRASAPLICPEPEQDQEE